MIRQRAGRLARAMRSRAAALGAYGLVVVVGGVGLLAIEDSQRDSCVQLRDRDLPAALAAWGQNFGEALEADQSIIDDFIVENERDLRRILPASDC